MAKNYTKTLNMELDYKHAVNCSMKLREKFCGESSETGLKMKIVLTRLDKLN